jgi:hypothetical protein
MVSEGGHVGDGLDVTGCDAAAVGRDNAAKEGGVLVVLDDALWPFGVKGLLTVK